MKKSRISTGETIPTSFLSFGAGVQSTALWLMIGLQKEKLIDKLGRVPERAFFADTGAEPKEIYEHIKSLQDLAQNDNRFLPIEIVRKTGPTLQELMLGRIGTRFVPIPAFSGRDKRTGGMLRRQCTREYKIAPLQKAFRTALGYQARQRIPAGKAESWIGISTDEAGRAKRSEDPWISKRYPLLELGMSRSDCAQLLRSHRIKPVKSRCCFCPYISDWQGFKNRHPQAFEAACQVDESIRDATKAGCTEPIFIHRSRLPLREALQHEQLTVWSEPWEDWGFEDECEGMCGL